MMGDLSSLFIRSIAAGLQKRSIVNCSGWASKYRIMGKPFPGKFSFRYHPWLKKMHDCDAEMWVGMKAAQVGFTETVLNRAFYYIDIRRLDVLYVLPSKTPDASDFSAARFDAALDLSDYLSDLFSDVKNVGHKRAGSTNLYIRGSHSRSSLKSIPAALLVLDEVEEMEQAHISLAMERQSGQKERQTILISTPMIANNGIHRYFMNTTQEEFFFKCPSCSRLTNLVFPDCLIITAETESDPNIENTHLICKECKNILPHQSKHEWLADGVWVPAYANRLSPGFHISQLYSCTETPSNIAKLYLKSQFDQSAEQEFYNSKLGEVHEVAGARVTEEGFDNCINIHVKDDFTAINRSDVLTLGVDQGALLHYEVDLWLDAALNYTTTDINSLNKPKVVAAGTLRDFEELDKLMYQYGINACVIDAHPEKRKALEFASRFPGFVYLCYYGEGLTGRNINEWSTEPAVTVDRTSWMDLALGRFRCIDPRHKQILIPKDIGLEYRRHIQTPVRTYMRDKWGNAIARYVTPENAGDHFAHARTYCEIALAFAAQLMRNQTIKSPR